MSVPVRLSYAQVSIASIESCCAEMAVAALLNLYWDGGTLNRYDERDVGGSYTIVGWICARAGKREEFWCDPTGCGRHAYFVPQSLLHDLDELRDLDPLRRAA